MTRKLWINNQPCDASDGGTVDVIDPATEEVVDTVPQATTEDAARAVEAATAAFPAWRRTPAGVRADLLHEAAARLMTRQEEFAVTLTRETGRTLRKNRGYVKWSADCLRYYAELGRHERGRVIPSPEDGQLSLVLKEPYGVVACIVPWNYPLLLLMWKVAPALAAGNTVVVKSATQTPLATMDLAGVFDHFPPGVVNLINGRGSVVGEALARHPEVPVIAFTGSVEVGRHIYRLGAERIKKVHLELGGNDAFIVCEDADLDMAARAAIWAAFLNAGQVCTSAERFYVQEDIADAFIEKLATLTENLVVGSGMDERTEVTPMINAVERARVHDQVLDAVRGGAEVVAGGDIPPGYERGFFYAPTVIRAPTADILMMREETFGPVAPVQAYRTFDEALALANGTDYGLGATLFSFDARRIRQYFEEIQAGNVWVNDPLIDNLAGPFGGMKLSGLGRELGIEGFDEFRETKHVHWDFEGRRKGWWYPYAEVDS